MKILFLILTAVICYVLGNFSGGMLLSAYVFKKNKAKYASANVKVLDFYQDFGLLGAVLLVLFDAVKAVAAVLIGGALMKIVDAEMVGRLFAVFCLMLGHTFPALFLFHGSKSLLCAGVAAFMVDWRVGLCCWVAYIVVIIFTRYAALGAVVSAVLGAIFMWVFGYSGLEGTLALLTALLIVIKYAENLVRIVGGTETKLDFGKASKPVDDDFEDDDTF